MNTGQLLYKKAKKLIPGGTQLLSKRPEQFLPELWPAYYKSAKGCEIIDLDNNSFVDMSFMGIGACSLGYADDDVDKAVLDAISKGNMCTLNAPEEIELAELLIQLHPWANMVRFARTGGEAMSIAVRIARAATNKNIILFCGYHGWHDWYLSANLADNNALDGQLLPGLNPKGVAHELIGTSIPFHYNDLNQFIHLVNLHSKNIAGVVVEAIRNVMPIPEFLNALMTETQKLKIPLIVDEVSSGFRLNCGGAHLTLGLIPNISVFAKGMSNGYPMAAIIGENKFMDAAQDSFISSTYWTERIGPAAALATINKMKMFNVPEHLISCGKKIQQGWTDIAKDQGVRISVGGIYPLSHFDFLDHPMVLKTLFTQEMLKKSFLATTSYYSCFAHNNFNIEKYLEATNEVFLTIRNAIDSGNPQSYLAGPVCQSGFKRLA